MASMLFRLRLPVSIIHKISTGSLIIVSFFVLGIIVGLCDVIPAGLLDSDVSYYALCCLMYWVSS